MSRHLWALVMMGFLVSCHGGASVPSGGGQSWARAYTRQPGDTVLADSEGVLVVAMSTGDGFEMRLGLTGTREARMIDFGKAAAVPDVQLVNAGGAQPLVFWSIDYEGLIVGALLRVLPDTVVRLYGKVSPTDNLCLKPRIVAIDGHPVLLEERAAVFPVKHCTDPAEDCPTQFLSTWPALYDLHGDSVMESSRNHPAFFAQRAKEYRDWAARIRGGANVVGQKQVTTQTIADRCGGQILDSLAVLANRADILAHPSPKQ